VPGRQLVGYLRFFEEPTGCRIEVHQRAADARLATFLSTAWSMVLGRLKRMPKPRRSLRYRVLRPHRGTGGHMAPALH
jgi:hypothetical protein